MAKNKMQIQNILLSEIDNESFANSRSDGWKEKSGDENAIAEFDDFVEGIRKNGQLTPVIVRPTGKSRKPYQLIVGFRRFEALTRIADGNKEATIKAEVKTDLSDYEARKMNAYENLDREDLSTQDQVWVVTQIWNEGTAAGIELTDELVAVDAGIGQSYAGRLLKVGKNVSQKILDHWRNSSVNPLTLEEMGKIADIEKPADQQKAYNELQLKKDAKREKSTKGPGAWVDTAVKQAEKVGGFLGLLTMLEQISPTDLKFDTDFLGLLVESGMLKLGKKGNDAKAKSRIVAAVKRGYKEGQKPREESEESADSEAAE